MSLTSQKTGNRTVYLRERTLNGIGFWDETPPPQAIAVFVPIAFLEQVEQCGLPIIDHLPFDNGVWVRFRSKRDADRVRSLIE